MMEVTWLIAGVALTSLLASGGALFVSMRIDNKIANFRTDFFREIDDRYVRKEEHLLAMKLTEREEARYRGQAKNSLDDIKVEVRSDKDDLMIVLNGIMAKLTKE